MTRAGIESSPCNHGCHKNVSTFSAMLIFLKPINLSGCSYQKHWNI